MLEARIAGTDLVGDRAALVETCSVWLNRSYYQETGEIVYKHIQPRILVEQPTIKMRVGVMDGEPHRSAARVRFASHSFAFASNSCLP